MHMIPRVHVLTYKKHTNPHPQLDNKNAANNVATVNFQEVRQQIVSFVHILYSTHRAGTCTLFPFIFDNRLYHVFFVRITW